MDWFITNRKLLNNEEEYLKLIKELSKEKVKYIILREKDLTNLEFEELYKKVKFVMDKKCKLIINSNIYVFKKYKEEYIHLPFHKFLEYKKEKDEKVGVSVHSLEEGIVAEKLGCDYILASNIYETKCKIGKIGMGTDFIRKLKKSVTCPIIALGGINDFNKSEVIKAGADGIAVMSYYIQNK